MKITVHTEVDQFDALAPEWDGLLSRSITNRIFLTFDWQRAWWATNAKCLQFFDREGVQKNLGRNTGKELPGPEVVSEIWFPDVFN